MAVHTMHDERQAWYRALADPGRRHLLRLLDDSEHPLGVAALADGVGLHPNTVRDHLDLLEEAGLVERTNEDRTRPGRPRILYRATAEETREPGSAGYRFLAEVLASGIQGMAEFPARVAEETGRAWGRYLVEEPAPHAPPLDVHDAMERVVGVLTDIGFAPEADSDDELVVRLHDCPFREVARTRREVVCSVHLGLLRGIAEKSGNVLRIDALEPFVEPSLCLIRVSPAGIQT